MNAYDQEKDSREFGKDAWVYCSQHMRPHTTGWCTVSNKNKIRLEATNAEAAYAECEQKGLALYRPNYTR
jgi:hypothetical protein